MKNAMKAQWSPRLMEELCRLQSEVNRQRSLARDAEWLRFRRSHPWWRRVLRPFWATPLNIFRRVWP